MSDWLAATLRTESEPQIHPAFRDSVAYADDEPFETDILDELQAERLTPVSQVEDRDVQRWDELNEELEQLRQIVQDYTQVIAPALAAMQHVPERMHELSELARDVRRSAEVAQRAAASVLPLERTLLRLIEESHAGDVDHKYERRSGSIGKLLRGHS